MKNMSPDKIKALLDQYLEGKTSLEEENQLIEFFQSVEVPEELEHFKAEFQHYGLSREQEPGDIVQNAIDGLGLEVKPEPRFKVTTWYRIAATFLLVAISFFLGYGFNVKSDLQEEVSSLKDQITDLKETTVNVMLQGESSHQRIQAIVMASQIEEVTDDLLNQMVVTLNEDNSPTVRSVALEFLGIHKDSDKVRSVLISSLLSQDLLSIQVELLWLIRDMGDKELMRKLKDLLDEEQVSAELKAEIKKIIQNNQSQQI